MKVPLREITLLDQVIDFDVFLISQSSVDQVHTRIWKQQIIQNVKR